VNAELLDIQNGRDACKRFFPASVAVRRSGHEKPIGAFVDQVEKAEIGKRLDGQARDVVEGCCNLKRLMKNFAGTDKKVEPFLVPFHDWRGQSRSSRVRYSRVRANPHIFERTDPNTNVLTGD
jgi:hypothetical protein